MRPLILKHATEKSLVILDELGRGTATFDGMAIAHAVLDLAVKATRAASSSPRTTRRSRARTIRPNAAVALYHMACVVDDARATSRSCTSSPLGACNRSHGVHLLPRGVDGDTGALRHLRRATRRALEATLDGSADSAFAARSTRDVTRTPAFARAAHRRRVRVAVDRVGKRRPSVFRVGILRRVFVQRRLRVAASASASASPVRFLSAASSSSRRSFAARKFELSSKGLLASFAIALFRAFALRRLRVRRARLMNCGKGSSPPATSPRRARR